MDRSTDWHEALSMTDVGVSILNADHRLVAWNERFVELGILPSGDIQAGLSLEEIYQLVANNGFFGNGDTADLARERCELLRAGDAPTVECLRRLDGRAVQIRRHFLEKGYIAAIFAEDNPPQTSGSSLRDTERLTTVGRAASGLVHDFNNLLMVVRESLEAVRAEVGTLEESESFRDAQRATESGAELARSVLGLVRSGTDQKETLRAGDVLEECRRFLMRILPENITLKVDAREAAFVHVDPSRFSSAILNLSLNARDAMIPNGGRLSLHARPEGATCEIVVRDNGRGMSPGTVARATAPLYRDDSGGRQGTGLGLAEVERFARDSHGSLTLESTQFVGTHARLTLPLAKPEQKPLLEPEEQRPLSGRVLLVEDDLAVRRVVVRMLEGMGIEARGTGSVAEALELLENEPFDLVISDFQLSGEWTGLGLYQLLRDQQPSLPFLLCSGWPELPVGDLPADVLILNKPFDRAELRHVLRSVLRPARIS